MTEPHVEPRWQQWTEKAARELGLDPSLIDIARIHEVSRIVAHDFERPLAPVSTYILGLAVGAAAGRADIDELTRRLLATIEGRDD